MEVALYGLPTHTCGRRGRTQRPEPFNPQSSSPVPIAFAGAASVAGVALAVDADAAGAAGPATHHHLHSRRSTARCTPVPVTPHSSPPSRMLQAAHSPTTAPCTAAPSEHSPLHPTCLVVGGVPGQRGERGARRRGRDGRDRAGGVKHVHSIQPPGGGNCQAVGKGAQRDAVDGPAAWARQGSRPQ